MHYDKLASLTKNILGVYFKPFQHFSHLPELDFKAVLLFVALSSSYHLYIESKVMVCYCRLWTPSCNQKCLFMLTHIVSGLE